MNNYIQHPAPGSRLIRFRGDTMTFQLDTPENMNGTGWLRTNIGQARIIRSEVIREVKFDDPPLGRDWFDIPMIQSVDGRFKVTIPLIEVGHFEAKCYFLETGKHNPSWPHGENTVINVQPADTCCANIIYNAFVRQFGPNKAGKGGSDPQQDQCVHSLDAAGYTVIPKSGTFRDLIRELDFIIGELGCRMIQLLPIHPTPTTYARMGRFGSPYAALSFTAVDPAQAEFDPKATPLEQFIELIDAVHERYAKIIIDIAINHTGWAAGLHETHPEWLVRDPEGKIEVPGAWGVMWEDLTKLDYQKKELWQYMADVFITWCRRGVDGFRCDAGYMIPVPAWKYILATVREQYPDTLFVLEGLGGKISVCRDILNHANFNLAYSELFQNYDRGQIEHYFPSSIDISQTDGLLVHFAETHDNNRLASRSIPYAKMRTALCALMSHNGGFGFANGMEWLATEKIDVHNAASLNWGNPVNQIDAIRRLNTLLKLHPAFHHQIDLKFVQWGGGNFIALLRHHRPSGKKVLVLANLDDHARTYASYYSREIDSERYWDLLSDQEIRTHATGEIRSLELEPGQVLCLSRDFADAKLLSSKDHFVLKLPNRILKQRVRAKAIDVFDYYHQRQHNGIRDMGNFNPDKAGRNLVHDPVEYCRNLNPFSRESRVITWTYPQDSQREVMMPPDHFLMVYSDYPFQARIMDQRTDLACEESLPDDHGKHFALFRPTPVPMDHRPLELHLSVFKGGSCDKIKAVILVLCHFKDARAKYIYHRAELLRKPLLYLDTNGRGGMLRAHASWGILNSKYDALLAANMHPDFPEDRRIMLSRVRGWIVYQGYSPDIRMDCLYSFQMDDRSRGFWEYLIPTGQGEHVCLIMSMEMHAEENAIRKVFYRFPCFPQKGMLDDEKPVQLILRPDIDDRNFHQNTKAYTGPEHHFIHRITPKSDGFDFTPAHDRQLRIRISQGTFHLHPEWHYMNYLPLEAERGMDAHTDIFSPGYFSAFLKGGEYIEWIAQVQKPDEDRQLSFDPLVWQIKNLAFERNGSRRVDVALTQAIRHFIVKRESLSTVIAGYPWFLDWGRDTLIVVRGLIAAGMIEESRAILKQFARFEKNGTLPNMIRGDDAGNRDTSDAPLWFFIACADLIEAMQDVSFLDEDCGGRTIRQILISMGTSLIKGTPNGIYMDAESGLLFSPSHFTWMDTNHPAGTPREGYPIEIQAFWFAALSLLSTIDNADSQEGWKKLLQQVQQSLSDLFYLPEAGYLSDCLAAKFGTPAQNAEPDDALRPNQLFAITMGAITDPMKCRNILAACETLLVPGAIRSLADRRVQKALAIYHHGRLLNNPHEPYHGVYLGDEDSQRKPAYHNGTAWTWVFPSYCEAWVNVYGETSAETALAWLTSCTRILNEGCIGQIPEILDGNYPHHQRGCDAQAWGASETLRVYLKLKTD